MPPPPRTLRCLGPTPLPYFQPILIPSSLIHLDVPVDRLAGGVSAVVPLPDAALPGLGRVHHVLERAVQRTQVRLPITTQAGVTAT